MHLQLIYSEGINVIEAKTAKWKVSDMFTLIHSETREIIRAVYFRSKRLGTILALPGDPNRYRRIDLKREGWDVIPPTTNYYKDNNLQENMWPFEQHQLVPVFRQKRL